MTSRTKLDTKNGFKISIQTEDKHQPSAITIKLLSWLTPLEEQDYKRAIFKHSKQLKQHLYKTINKTLFNQDRTILFIDSADKLMNTSKSSFASINVTLYQNKPYQRMKSELMFEELKSIADSLMNVLLKMDKFSFNKNKSK